MYNIGVNDFGVATEAAWIANVLTVADAVHSRWPNALFYLMRPWMRSHDADADTYAGWIDQVVAARSFARLGPDERIWFKGSDNGVTMSDGSGVHYGAAGEAECAAQWKTILGY